MPSRVIATAFICALAAPAAAVLADGPRAGLPVIVIVAPWVDAPTVVRAAGGQLIGPVSAPLAALAYSPDPDFAERLTEAGALAVRDGQRLALICGVA